jgi:hypothetical protein
VDKDRSVTITIGGVEYDLILTTAATKQIGKRYGGIENLGEKLMKSENVEMAIEEIGWLIALLANQSVRIYNLSHKDNPKPEITEEEVELLTNPLELMDFKPALTAAMFKGMARNIESEDDSKNKVGA